MILIYPSLIIVQIVPIRCVSKSHRLKIDFQDENYKNLFLCNHKAQNLDIRYVTLPSEPLSSFLNDSPGAKNGPAPGVIRYLGLYRVQHGKIFLSETTMPQALLFGM